MLPILNDTDILTPDYNGKLPRLSLGFETSDGHIYKSSLVYPILFIDDDEYESENQYLNLSSVYYQGPMQIKAQIPCRFFTKPTVTIGHGWAAHLRHDVEIDGACRIRILRVPTSEFSEFCVKQKRIDSYRVSNPPSIDQSISKESDDSRAQIPIVEKKTFWRSKPRRGLNKNLHLDAFQRNNITKNYSLHNRHI
jgi:hypothetical protein